MTALLLIVVAFSSLILQQGRSLEIQPNHAQQQE